MSGWKYHPTTAVAGEHEGRIHAVRAGIARQPRDEDHRGQARGEDVELSLADHALNRLRPAEHDAPHAREHRNADRHTDPTCRGHERHWHGEQEGEEAELVRGGAILAAAQEQEEFGGPAAAVEDGRLGVAGLELGIVTGGDAAGREGAGPERAVVEVERMPPGEDGPIVGDRGPGRSGPKRSSARPACATTSAATAMSHTGRSRKPAFISFGV